MYLTADVPGVEGRIRERIEDFVVEELPLYEPAGVGEHCYLTVQKVGLSTHEAIRRLAREIHVRPEAIGYAGMKDAKAVARQTFSIQGLDPHRVEGLAIPGLTVLAARLHRNKLRIGHLAGNRFLIRLRGTGPGAEERCRLVLDALSTKGLPNLFGRQRFGSKGDGHLAGRAVLRRDPEALVDAILLDRDGRERDPRLREARDRYASGDLEGAFRAFPHAYEAERRVLESLAKGRPPEQAIRRIPRATFRLYLSAYQSHLFNRLLLVRMPDLGRLEAGDLAYLHDRGAVFSVEDVAVEQPRADRFEISPSGPLFGKKVLLAEGAPGEREREVLDEERLTIEQWKLPGLRLDGERRPFRVPLTGATVRAEGDDTVLLAFSLPKGSYATAALREVMKSEDPDLD
jgi:tRNA pseudouridine13 synthase